MWKPQKAPFRNTKKDIFKKVIAVSDFIYQIGEYEALRKPSKDVVINEITSKEFQQKVSYLKSCLKIYRKKTGMGRGITAVQVGIPQRFSVIYMPEVQRELVIIVNPLIIKRSEVLLKYPEICMSANPLIAPVIRPSWITFTYYDEQGNKQAWDRKDTTKQDMIHNRVFQHEIDHMDGIINIDTVQSKELIFESDPLFYEKATFQKVKHQSR